MNIRIHIKQRIYSYKKIIIKLYNYIIKQVVFLYEFSLDNLFCSYSGKKIGIDFDTMKFKFDNHYYNKINLKMAYLEEKYLQHQYDILGSGWMDFSEPISIDRIGNKINRSNKIISNNLTKELFCKLSVYDIAYCYKPIIWNIDIKSAYRYPINKWSKYIKIQQNHGIDIKIPWELSRMQHLPQLSIMAINKDDSNRIKLLLEIRSQCLDFISNNPPRWGVNWTCSMDIGIRASNMIFAYKIAKSMDAFNIFDIKFEAIFSSSIYDHAKHIINNLENKGKYKGNHYLADITGLLFSCSFLDTTYETNHWMAFSINELCNCIMEQFNEDGSNKEASTAYHCFCCEMIIYAIALIIGLSKTNRFNDIYDMHLKKTNNKYIDINSGYVFSDECMCKVIKMGKFINHIMKPDGNIPLIGDNDSGRFVKFFLDGDLVNADSIKKKYLNLSDYNNNEKIYFDTNDLDYTNVLAAFGAVFEEKELEAYALRKPVINQIVSQLSCGIKYKDKSTDSFKDNINKAEELSVLSYEKKTEILFHEKININDLQFYKYIDFGIYIYKNKDFYVSVSATNNGQNGRGGHAHNDKLSIELQCKGIDYLLDPGTYLYTPNEKIRNQFRSVMMHNSIIVNNQEQNIIPFKQLFDLKDETLCGLIDYDKNYIKLSCIYRDVIHIRSIYIKESGLIIIDQCNQEFQSNFKKNYLVSNGYGKIYNFINQI